MIGSGAVRAFQWTLEAGGDNESYWTGLRVTGPGDYRCSGGMAGPKLWGDDLINTYSARNDGGPLGIAVRARPDVTRVMLRTRDGDLTDLLPCEPDVIDELRFYVGFVWPDPSSLELRLDELRAFDADGQQVETYDLSFWDRTGRR